MQASWDSYYCKKCKAKMTISRWETCRKCRTYPCPDCGKVIVHAKPGEERCSYCADKHKRKKFD